MQAIRGPQVKTARNLFALPIPEPQSEARFAQNLDDFLAAYDWTVPMAMPLMESVPIDASRRLTRLVQAVARHPGALKKTIFELQARDWNRRQQNAIPDQQLADWMRLLRLNGVKTTATTLTILLTTSLISLVSGRNSSGGTLTMTDRIIALCILCLVFGLPLGVAAVFTGELILDFVFSGRCLCQCCGSPGSLLLVSAGTSLAGEDTRRRRCRAIH